MLVLRPAIMADHSHPPVEFAIPLRPVGIARGVLATQELLQQLCRPALLSGHGGESLSASEDLGHLVLREHLVRHGELLDSR